jgi:hypothetical protein
MKDVAIDACCLINLLATGTIFPAPPFSNAKGKTSTPSGATLSLNRTLHVPTAVASEALFLLHPDDDDKSKLVKAPIDLTPHCDAGVLHPCDVQDGEETNLFVQFATRLDDGEAACLAIAKNRGWAIGTDDRLATILAGQFSVSTVSTAELVKEWAKISKAKKAQITHSLLNIQRFAKFIPRQNSPEAGWWYSHACSE